VVVTEAVAAEVVVTTDLAIEIANVINKLFLLR
jgi:hypothetical protein